MGYVQRFSFIYFRRTRGKRVKKLLIGIVSSILLINIHSMVAQADTVDYQVGAIKSTHQVDTAKSYFDLKLDVAQEDDIQVKVVNVSDKEITIDTSIDRAITNHNGVVAYDVKTGKSTDNIPYKIEDVITTQDKKITLAPKETKLVNYHVKVPTKAFDGVLSGGISFREESTDKDSNKKSSMAIENQFGYVIAVLLHGESEVVKPDLTLGKVNLGQINNRNVVYVPLQNIKAMYVNKLSVSSQITKKGSKKVLYSENKADMQMAPNSILNYPISLNEANFKPGKYTVDITAKSKGHVWKFSQSFEIKDKEAKKLNEKAIIKKKEPPYIIYGLILLFIIFIAFVVRYMIKKQKQIKQLQKKLKEKDVSIE